MRRRFLPLCLLPILLACGEAVKDDHFARELNTSSGEPAAVDPGVVPVRIGELGANFNACNAAGTGRNLTEGVGLPVRTAPYDNAAVAGSIPADARFYICTRSHDQRWLGIVYGAPGTLDPGCGVSRPITARQAYEGPCRSGWVPSAFVKQIAG